jgi:TolB protein
MEVTAGPETEELGEVQHQLSARLEEKFGKGARVQQVFGLGDEVLLGVTVEARMEETDVRIPLALASFRKPDNAVAVIADNSDYREARLLPSGMAVVTAAGELRLRAPNGTEQTLATDVKGEVSAAPNGALIATLEGGARQQGDSAVFLVDAAGTMKVIADGEGVDDRPSVSPDRKTVVFVSGRTGVASLWRTTLDGADPVQLTNANIEVGVERTGPPDGFVPPPVMADRLEWLSADVVRYDAGEGEFWNVNVRTGEANREGASK